MSLSKVELRKEKLAQRKLLTADEIEHKSKVIRETLQTYLDGKRVGMFDPIRNEVDLRPLFDEKTALPKITDTMTLHQYTNEFQTGVFGIREPLGPIMDVEIVVVPGAVFDLEGYRIGYGGGYYDRYLKPHHLKIGVCFDFQIIDKLPHESFDIPLDILITEKRVLRWI